MPTKHAHKQQRLWYNNKTIRSDIKAANEHLTLCACVWRLRYLTFGVSRSCVNETFNMRLWVPCTEMYATDMHATDKTMNKWMNAIVFTEVAFIARSLDLNEIIYHFEVDYSGVKKYILFLCCVVFRNISFMIILQLMVHKLINLMKIYKNDTDHIVNISIPHISMKHIWNCDKW